MMTILFTKRTIWVLTILFVASLGLLSAQAADREPASVATPGSDTITEPGIAAGSVEDTLQACIARIPKDASIGQRMIAEQGCGRDENDRKPIQAIPGARSTAVTGPAEPSEQHAEVGADQRGTER